MNYVIQAHDIFSKEECAIILNKRIESSTINGELRDFLIYDEQPKDIEWQNIFDMLKARLFPIIKEYTDQFLRLFPMEALEVSHIGFLNDKDGSFTETHYDWEFVEVAGKKIVKPFVCLIYLTDDYEGGELFFPLLNFKSNTKVGSIIVLPCSFMFPHLSLPTVKGNKHVCRVTFKINEKCFKVDALEI